ncbi:cobalamin B12-binding domain-containing protein [Alkalicella caledoniensis]|uniref:Cobalamin B12-binding domain-containing protein n=1 Tax=Alkalicella caledoniensis TaxID=2731377 RepID=A0A7G9W5E6_ALKCA|nr:cobalamin B12-binding domain-containing protein [Alkalicella caledoniensis]QNO13908.1 cobalamin B12-binding domain-containing protein [Alkalicella caledoniensis]
MTNIKVLVAKPGLDGHDRGAKVVARGLMEHGMEVVYTGIRQTPEKIVNTAIQEGVDVIGLSCLSGAHNHLFSKIMMLLQESQYQCLVVGGGIIPKKDIPYLLDQGLDKIFIPGTSIKEMVDFIKGKLNA